MSLVKRCVLSNFTYSACRYLFNDTRVNPARYYTCLNNSANRLRIIKYQNLENHNRRDLSLLENIKDLKFTISSKLRNFTHNMFLLFPIGGSEHKRTGYLLFKTLDDVNIEDFFTLFEMDDTFYSRFQVIELHVWMLLCHLPRITRRDHLIRVGLIEAMWKDSENRSSLLCSKNINVKKNFRNLYGEFLFSELFYDYCFQKGDAALASAVWCNFFNKRNVSPRNVEALVSYIRLQMHRLNSINFQDESIDYENIKIWIPIRSHVEKIYALT